MAKDYFQLLKNLQDSFPKAFIDDFSDVNIGIHYEVIEDHLKNAEGLSSEEIEELKIYLRKRHEEEFSLCEAVANISLLAGEKGYTKGVGIAEDILDFINWAKEFEFIHRNTNWGIDAEYPDEIMDFTLKKIAKK